MGRNLYNMRTVLRGSHEIMDSVPESQTKEFKFFLWQWQYICRHSETQSIIWMMKPQPHLWTRCLAWLGWSARRQRPVSSLLSESQKTHTGLGKPEGPQLEEGKKLELFSPKQLWRTSTWIWFDYLNRMCLSVSPCFISTSEVATTVSKLPRYLLCKQQTFSHEPQLESPSWCGILSCKRIQMF